MSKVSFPGRPAAGALSDGGEMGDQAMKFGIGQPVPRTEDPRFLKGVGRYVADLNPPNLAHGVVLRSPHANADRKSVV